MAANGAQFAKHFKLEEQVSFLQKSRTGIAVGTPQRLIDLIENGTAQSYPRNESLLTGSRCLVPRKSEEDRRGCLAHRSEEKRDCGHEGNDAASCQVIVQGGIEGEI
jgi:hypothetical protein